ncbi:MAG: organic solvent ABC transporter substrate-binding protein [Bdellovibrionaceae bacterium]|nr:organic solvent ABC transporter substrate-binding protein [Pseudobdellovibrionaceae bacterium]
MNSRIKVALLFLTTLVGVVIFGYLLGFFQPFLNQKNLTIAYNFAGGLDVGSKVRVMGIPVGSVKSIDFAPEHKMDDGEEVKLLVHIQVDRAAWSSLKKDSRFYINLAGVIGEKYLEITPGTASSPGLSSGDTVRGEDPPRIDQLLSQSYSLAGKALEFFNDHESSITDTINTMNNLVVNLNTLLRQVNKTGKNQDIEGLIRDIRILTKNLAYFSEEMRSPEGQKTLKLINELIGRLEGLDAPAIRKFLQEEGIKAKLF